MKGLSAPSLARQQRSKSSCSFCRSTEHQVSQCPHVEPIWNNLEQGIIPLAYIEKVSNQSAHRYNPFNYYLRGDNWGDLFKQTAKAHTKVEAYKERQRQKALNKGKAKTKRTKVCGYCGGQGHTRRTCGLLASHKTKLQKANRAFRTWVYNELVVERGLSTGAIVKLTAKIDAGYNRSEERKSVTTLVTDVNWDSMNVFAVMATPETDWSRARQVGIGQERLANIANFFISQISVKTSFKTWDDAGFSLSNGYGTYGDLAADGVGVPYPTGHGSSRLTNFATGNKAGWQAPSIEGFEVVSRAPQVLPSDWIDGFSDEMSVIFRKFSQDELDAIGVLDHIKEWAEKDVE